MCKGWNQQFGGGRDVAHSTTAGQDEWFTLDQASRLLGVHPTTLRRWANHGQIDVFLTPGGHRRFLRSDLESFRAGHHTPALPAPAEGRWLDHAVACARAGLPQQRWVTAYSEPERESRRQMGRRLMGLLLQYMARSGESTDLLAEARFIGEQHARGGLKVGQPLGELLQVISFFRMALLETALLDVPEAARNQEASSRLLHRVERLLGEVQTGVVDLYLTGDRDRLLSPVEE